MSRTEGVIGSLVTLGGLGLVVWAWQLPAGHDRDPLGPRGFPLLVGLALVVCGLALLGLAWRGRIAAVAIPLDADGPLAPGQLLGGIALTALYVWALEPLGYLLATPPFLAAILVLQGGVRLPAFLWTVLALPAALFLVFAGLMKVPLPLGVLERILPPGGLF
jgi:putative tricarboxylic transport membrane protein